MKNIFITFIIIVGLFAYSPADGNDNSTRDGSISVSSYPNPVYHGNVNISIQGVDNVGVLSFYSLRGQKMNEIELDKASSVNLSNANGLILYQYVNSKGQKIQGKFISFSEHLVVSVESFPAENMLVEDGVLKSFVVGMNPIISALDGSTLGVNGNKIVLDGLQMDWNLVDYAPDPQYSYIVNPASVVSFLPFAGLTM